MRNSMDDLDDCHVAKSAKCVYQLFYNSSLHGLNGKVTPFTDLKFKNASTSLNTTDSNYEQGFKTWYHYPVQVQ